MSTANSNKRGKLIFHWFRQGDLRLHDNPALAYTCKLAASNENSVVVPVFNFDTANILGDGVKSSYGHLKCGPQRAKFLIESVVDLKQNLQQNCNTNLVITQGDPGTSFANLLEQIKKGIPATTEYEYTVVCQEEVVKEEKDACKKVNDSIKRIGGPKSTLHQIWGSTMYDLKDLPFNVNNGLQDMPDVFTPFRNKVEKKSQIAKPLPSPSRTSLKLPPKDSPEGKVIQECMSAYNKVPTLSELGYTDEQVSFAMNHDKRGVMQFKGGETAGLERVKDYIWTKDLLKEYFDTRNGMLGADYSTKFAPWLAHGCISARHVAMECRKYEEQRVANKSTYWVVFELLWRDFCKFFAYKHGDAIFFPGGTIGSDKPWKTFDKSIEAWKEGKTGYPLVDANMRELKATGFMSNRGRQNVASFLTIDLAQDWRFGGEWFEQTLIDYDVYSNWVNWCAAAGMTGGRLNRFNIVKQSKDYDQHGDYVRHWLPELKDVPKEFVHEPWKMTQFQQTQYNVRLGVDYPQPIIPPSQPSNNNYSRDGKGGRGGGGKQRKPNNSNKNRAQKYEMKSLKTGGWQIKG